MTEKRKSLPWPFNYAKLWYGVELQGDDIDYINNVIISKCIKEYFYIYLNFISIKNHSFYLEKYYFHFLIFTF